MCCLDSLLWHSCCRLIPIFLRCFPTGCTIVVLTAAYPIFVAVISPQLCLGASMINTNSQRRLTGFVRFTLCSGIGQRLASRARRHAAARTTNVELDAAESCGGTVICGYNEPVHPLRAAVSCAADLCPACQLHERFEMTAQTDVIMTIPCEQPLAPFVLACTRNFSGSRMCLLSAWSAPSAGMLELLCHPLQTVTGVVKRLRR